MPTYAKAPIGGIPAARAAERGLTPREFTVLILLAEALTAAAIGRRLGISARTVHRHLEHLYRKLNTSDRLGAVLRAQDLGLLPSRADTGHSGTPCPSTQRR